MSLTSSPKATILPGNTALSLTPYPNLQRFRSSSARPPTSKSKSPPNSLESVGDLNDSRELRTAYHFELNIPTLAIFTGAGTPLTRAMALKFAEGASHPDSAVLISSQNAKALESTAHHVRKNSCIKVRSPQQGFNSKSCPPNEASRQGLEVHIAALDFVTNTEALAIALKQFFGTAADVQRRFRQALIVHNAGRITVSKRPEDFSSDEVANYLRLNVTSAICLNTAFMDLTAATSPAIGGLGSIRRFVVNVSSPLAITPVSGLGLGCASKAAREAYFKVVALENPEMNVINYSPGPIRVDTWQTLVDSNYNQHIKQRDFLVHSAEDSSFLTIDTKATVVKLMQLLESGSYISGDHVDYLDVATTVDMKNSKLGSSAFAKGKVLSGHLIRTASLDMLS